MTSLPRTLAKSRNIQHSDEPLGPLAELLGTWAGGEGWNLIAVPDPSDKEPFLLKIAPYFETLTFKRLVQPIPNKGSGKLQLVHGIEYSLTIADKENNQPLHAETGMWIIMDKPEDHDLPIARQTIVPHGNSILAMGNFSRNQGSPQIGDICTLPHNDGFDLQACGVASNRNSYSEPYFTAMEEFKGRFDVFNPNATLRKAIKEQEIVGTTTLAVSTKQQGGLVNIPYIVKEADASLFESVFWIETVRSVNESGEATEFKQLQYSQNTLLDFLTSPSTGETIRWPHVTINTLVQQ